MNDDWYASLDDWKTRSDLEGVRTAKACPACLAGVHDKCWHHPAQDRCSCAMREHKEG